MWFRSIYFVDVLAFVHYIDWIVMWESDSAWELILANFMILY